MGSAGGVRTSVPRRSVLAMAMAAAALLGATSAWASQDPVDLQVIDRDTGQPLRVWRHQGRLYVAGEPDRRYSLRLTNNTDGRVLVVVSVDGVNIVTGETAGYNQRGYVLGPHRSDEINGWRKSETEVAAFSFASLSQSYAARTGRPSDVGVIGMAVFREKIAPPPPAISTPAPRDEARRGAESASRAMRAAPASPPPPVPPAAQRVEEPQAALAPRRPDDITVTARRRDERLGTAHGPREWSVANIVSFERATRHPQFIRQIEYDTYANLAANGVIPAPPYAERRPRPFPARPGPEGYVPDPPPRF